MATRNRCGYEEHGRLPRRRRHSPIAAERKRGMGRRRGKDLSRQTRLKQLRPIYIVLVHVVFLFALASCGESNGERFRRFAANCLLVGFSQQQCLFLYAMQQDASSSLDTTSFLTGMAVGIGAGMSGSSGSKGR